MGAVWMVASRELRGRYRRVIALALLVGAVGAVVMATAAGARRSDTALDRFRLASRASDLGLQTPGLNPSAAQLDAVRHLPGVLGIAVVRGMLINVAGVPDLVVVAAVDTSLGDVVDGPRVVAGRLTDPAAIDEINIGEALAARLHIGVGGQLSATSYTPQQMQQANDSSAGPLPAPGGPNLELRVVGIVRRPLDLGDRSASGGVLVATPAFLAAYDQEIGSWGSLVRVRTAHPARDVPGVTAGARRIFANAGMSVDSVAIETEGARNAIDVLTLALWASAGVAALAGVVAVGMVLTGEIAFANRDHTTFSALGLTRSQQLAASTPSTLLIAAGGALAAVVGATAASALFPIGVARRADPHPGFHLDFTVLAWGAGGMVVVVAAVALLAAIRTSRPSSPTRTRRARSRSSFIAEITSLGGLGPSASGGLHMALDPGRGDTAVPIRSSLMGTGFGVMGITAVLVFGASLHHLGAAPSLSGWNWDFAAPALAGNTCDRGDQGLGADPAIAALAAICYQNAVVDGRPVTAWGFALLRGSIQPSVIAGHAPEGPGEVALGAVTLRALGKKIGDTVEAGLIAQGADPTATERYQIVGQIVLPNLGGSNPLADGAAFTDQGFAPIADPNNFARYFLFRLAPHADRAAVEHRLVAAAQGALGDPIEPTSAVEVNRLRQVSWLPATLALVLGGLGLLALGHTLVSAVHHRRRDLGVLKALGFDRRQLRATIAWQSTILATAGLLVGIPVGLIVGSLIWRRIASGLGVVTSPSIPVLSVALLVPAAIALVNLVAYFPGRAAARTPVAVALRTE